MHVSICHLWPNYKLDMHKELNLLIIIITAFVQYDSKSRSHKRLNLLTSKWSTRSPESGKMTRSFVYSPKKFENPPCHQILLILERGFLLIRHLVFVTPNHSPSSISTSLFSSPSSQDLQDTSKKDTAFHQIASFTLSHHSIYKHYEIKF